MDGIDNMPTLGTVQVGEIFNVSKTTVSSWCREKKFPKAYQRKKGCPWHIPISDVEAMMKKKGIDKKINF